MDTTIARGCLVVGVDGSEHANRAVIWAAEQADLEGRGLVLLHGSHGARVRDGDWVTLWGADREEVERVMGRADGALVEEAARLATAGHPGVDVRALVVDGDAREVLVQASRTAHLVVVGSRGRSPWRDLVLGSVTSAVYRQASCPVVVTGLPGSRSAQPGVLVGADGTAGSVPVIEFAFRMASLRGLPLTVMHCYWDIAGELTHGRVVGPGETGVDDLRLLLSESVAGMSEKFPDVEVDLQLARGLVDMALTDRTPARDLVVVGRRHPTTWSRLLYGSATTAVLERAEGNVAVVPEPGPITARGRQ
jgi:nucleotide-binding universal stress UspA family protein